MKGDGIVEFSTGNETSNNAIGSYDEEKSKTNLLKQIGDGKKSAIILTRMKHQLFKQTKNWHN